MSAAVGALALLAVSGCGGAGTESPGAPPTSTASASPQAAPLPQRTEVWREDFEGDTLDPTRWVAYHSVYGFEGSGQIQCHQPGNAVVADGELRITARQEAVVCPGDRSRDYSSGFVSSREADAFYPMYGRYEARLRVPHGQGVGAAFWLRRVGGAGFAEVDVMEVFHAQHPGSVTQTLHFPLNSGRRMVQAVTPVEQGVQGTGEWHTYAVDIEPVTPGDNSQVRFTFLIDGRVRPFEVDGRRVRSWVDDQASRWTDGVDPQRTWDIALSVPVGGAWWGHPTEGLGYLSAGLDPAVDNPNLCSLTMASPTAGPASCPTDQDGDGRPDIWFAQFPATYDVDWVRYLS